MANYIDQETLLQDKRVLAEIDRHLWIESEKAGRDIGFEEAKQDWLKNFSKSWMSYHMPDMIIAQAKARRAAVKKQKPLAKKRRSAKSYLK